MRFLFFLIALITAIAAKKTTTSQTSVWRTGTNSDGVLVSTEGVFSQKLMSTYGKEDTDTVPVGSIGLGSLNGAVGKVRTYKKNNY